ncbi:hypothetical protein [[Limnothrix rosea] IAM M-220]|nr:hypothetical protein [[Limnothrix rosea] IAM M-220]
MEKVSAAIAHNKPEFGLRKVQNDDAAKGRVSEGGFFMPTNNHRY